MHSRDTTGEDKGKYWEQASVGTPAEARWRLAEAGSRRRLTEHYVHQVRPIQGQVVWARTGRVDGTWWPGLVASAVRALPCTPRTCSPLPRSTAESAKGVLGEWSGHLVCVLQASPPNTCLSDCEEPDVIIRFFYPGGELGCRRRWCACTVRPFGAHFQDLRYRETALKNKMMDQFVEGVRRVTCHVHAHAHVVVTHITPGSYSVD
jgi:hypothetical protein